MTTLNVADHMHALGAQAKAASAQMAKASTAVKSTALRKLLPPQKRSVADLHAMELVNIDGLNWDVFVRFPDGRIARPMMIAIQDVFSRKFLSWRIGESESAIETRLCFADLSERG